MRGFVVRLLISMAALWITVTIGKAIGLGMSLGGVVSAFEVVIALAIVNALVRPIVMLLTMPLNCLTFGIFGIVVNALMFMLVQYLVPGFRVGGFWGALFATLVMGPISGLINHLIGTLERR
jgi:putative membrane protein